MSSDRSWTLAWNEREAQFFARYRKVCSASRESAWGTKRIPKTFGRHQQLDAERWMIDWYAQHMRTGGLNAPASNVVPAAKMLRLLGPLKPGQNGTNESFNGRSATNASVWTGSA